MCIPARFARFLAMLFALAALWPVSAWARESLGIYETWGAFRDPVVPRCYAVAMAEPSRMQRDYQPFATIGNWPRRNLRNQVHFRLSRQLAPRASVSLRIGDQRFTLTGGGGDAWAADPRDNAAIVAAMRSASRMVVQARDAKGRNFTNTWPLAGAASAMDAAAIGCSRLN